MNTEENKELGQTVTPKMILGFVVVFTVVVIGVLYLWGSQLKPSDLVDTEPKPRYTNNEPETPRAKADVQAANVMSSSDEPSAIEADITSTNIEGADTDIESMNAEINTFNAQIQ